MKKIILADVYHFFSGFFHRIFVENRFLRLKIPFVVFGYVFMIPFGFFCAYQTHAGSANGLGVLWSLIFPVISILLLGIKYGVYLNLVMGVVLSTIVFTPEYSIYQYELSDIGTFFSVYVLLAVITIISEFIRVGKEDEISQLNTQLQQERDELTTMKDNLSVGIFMIDQSFIIQPYYSEALEDILSHSNLTGMSILDVFVDSITIKQRNTLKDYFAMMFNMTHNMKLLEEINPISEVEYVSAETRAKRTLHCKFSCIQRQKDTLLLGAIYDITEQAKTEKQLKEEGNKRQAEMQSLFEIIQIEPAVFDEFIEDTDYQFDRLNSILKRKDLSSKEVIISFYQSIHAIKSNAVILGLEGFAEKCHALEDDVKRIQEKPEAKFEDLLHLTMELDKLFIERDTLELTLDKIKSFRKESSSESIFVVSLRKAIDRVAVETGKLAVLNAENIDDEIVRSDLRNILKEIVLQFARNAVFHGIETPEKRISLNKAPHGTIILSIKKIDDMVEIVISDDGKGIDFQSVKERAMRANVLPPNASQNQILAALFVPSFSTANVPTMSAGRGIGLSLVAERLKELNGKLSISTKEGVGASFIMRFPYKT
jgi:two-component system chemotaxis sensor kinase CheA